MQRQSDQACYTSEQLECKCKRKCGMLLVKYDTNSLTLKRSTRVLQIKDEPADPREHVETVMDDAEPV